MRKSTLFLSVLLCAATSTTVASKNSIEMSLTPVIKTILGIDTLPPPDKPEDLLLIGAGFGRTGTTSFLEAMDRLGLKSYHMGMAGKTPGHFDMWVKYSQLLRESSSDSQESVDMANQIIDSFRDNGFNATASMPACCIYKQFMERYPNARVVMTVRGDGDGHAWAKSVQSSIGLILKYASRVPLRWSPMKKLQTFMNNFFSVHGVYFNDNMELDNNEWAQMYNDWVQKVRDTVPADRLLVFAAQDGWGPLCEFVSPLSAEIAVNCQGIIASGEPYPRANDKAFVQRVLWTLNAVCTCFELGPYVVAFVLLVVVLIAKGRSNNDKIKNSKND